MKKFMLLLAFVMLGFVYQAKASHLVSGEFKVDYLGGNDYNVSFIFIRDCSGVPMPSAITFSFSSGLSNFTATAPLISQQIMPTACSGLLTTCNGGSLFGLEKNIYQVQVTLAPAEWHIWYTDCCRNPINTLQNPTSMYWYIDFTFNSLLAPGNHFPYFGSEPFTVIKSNNIFHYNHGATDPDGDSVSIKMVAPMQNTGTPVTYMGPLNGQNWLFGNSTIIENFETGDLTIMPSQQQMAVYGVEISEWKTISGVPTLVSKHIRDAQVYVNPVFANEIPVLAGINPQATTYSTNDTIYRMPVTAGDTIDFDIYSHHPLGANMTLVYPKQIPGSVYSITQNYTPNVTGHFFWVPTSSQIVKGPAIMLARISDSTCPFNYFQIYSYSFDVSGLTIFLLPGNNANLLLGESYSLTANCSAANTFDWYVDGIMVQSGANTGFTFLSQDLGPGDHTVGCKAYNSAKSDMQGFEFVNVHVENVWGIENDTDERIGIYPNPVNDVLNIKSNIPVTSIKLFDLQGRLIQTYAATAKQIEVGQLSRGVYVLSINGNINRKIVLK